MLGFIVIDLRNRATPAAVGFGSPSFIAINHDSRTRNFPVEEQVSSKCSVTHCGIKELAPRGGFEPPTFRLTAEMIENLSALSGVAYEKSGAIFPSLVAPTPAPTPGQMAAQKRREKRLMTNIQRDVGIG